MQVVGTELNTLMHERCISASTVTSGGGAGTASLPAQVGMVNVMTFVSITCDAVASVEDAAITITGLVGGTWPIRFVETVSAGGAYVVSFHFPIPAAAPNTAITINIPSVGSGGVVAAIIAGYYIEA